VSNQVAVVVTVIAGGLIALQAPLNAGLGKSTGNLPAATVNFLVGTVVLIALIAVIGQLGQVREATSVPWYYIVGGGFLGAIYVTTALLTVHQLGAGGVTAATITGQLTASLIADRLGILGLAETAITPGKIAGVVLLLAGTLLIIR